MHAYILAAISLAASITASATPAPNIPSDVLSDKVMSLDSDLGTVSKEEWLSKLSAAGFLLEKPEIDKEFMNFTAPVDLSPEGSLEKRQSCENTISIVTDRTQRFVDWDVQMSPVACATGAMDISVTSGFSVANSVQVNGGGSPTFIKDRLGASFGVSFSRTWTTTTSILTKGTVPDGSCGVMITQPLTTRRYGRTFQGCIGSTKQIGTWMADDHGKGSYNGVEWISGSIGMCVKKQTSPPLTRCNGSGEFE